MAFKHGNHTLIDLDAGNDTKITSATGQDIVFYPDQHIWIKQGTKLIFEGTVPDDFEAKLQATSVTADRDLILPDEDGTLATQAYVTSAVSGGSLANTDALAEGSTNLYYTDARADVRATLRINAATTDNISEGSTNLYHTDARALAATDGQEVKFKNLYTNLADLPSATSYHGMFAHVHTEGKGYFAHAGNWIPLANESSVPTDLTDLSIADGNADEVLKTDGSGNFSFVAVSALTGSGIQNIADDSTPELGGDLITGQNRIAFADTGTVSFLDFTTNLFSETNHTVLSSVKSIDFFLDSNGGDSGQAFRIYNNQNPDGTVTENTHIFKVAENGDVSVSNDLTVAGSATITGDLTVSGTTTTVNSNTVNIGDSIITLNSDETGAPTQNGGFEIERGTSTNVSFVWDETNDEWTTSAQTLKSGHFLPETDVTYDLGSSALKWRDLYLSGSTIKLGGATLSASGANLSLGSGSFDLSNSDTDDISEGASNLYYTDARTRNHIEGADLDLGANKILYSNVYSNTGDLPTASSYHGMFAHVHGTGKGYYAHAGNWVELANQSDIPTNNNTLTNGAGYITSAGTATNFSSTTQNSQFNSIGVGTAGSGTTGEIRATNDVTAYYSSDANLKTNVVNIDNALDKVKQIRGVEFDWTQEYIDEKGGEDGYFVRKHDVGVIAQEVEAVLPEVVGTRDNGTKAVRYDRMVALLIEAIKDQQSQIDELKQIITDLGNK